MPYLLKEYFSGATLAASSHAPAMANGAEQFDQIGWSPQAARLPLVEGGVYRLDDPKHPGRRRRIRVNLIAAAQNAITYTVEGEACNCACEHARPAPVAA